MLFDRYDRTRVINLRHRTDRRQEMEREFARIGLANWPRIDFFPAIAPGERGPFSKPAELGVYLSHLQILEEAASQGESVLILEDDCDFFPEVQTYELPDGVDVFYGGYLAASNPDDLHDCEITGAHFMGFSKRAAPLAARYLRSLLDPSFPPDPRAAMDPGYDPAIRPPVDGAYLWFRRAHPDLVTVFAMLGTQRPSRSDIADQRWFDGIPLLREAAGLARRIKRWSHRMSRRKSQVSA